MLDPSTQALELELRHTGERIALRRLRYADGTASLEIRGSLPARGEGPPFHVHFQETETGHVTAGVLSASVDGEIVKVAAGESATFPAGSIHRWWNDGDETLEFHGIAEPVIDLDRYLQAIFDVVNAGKNGRPSLFYIAHVARRHRHTQQALLMPRIVQRVLFPLVVLLGHVLGKYRGTGWPGCPSRCPGAPEVGAEEA